jgi:hypothetical protein
MQTPKRKIDSDEFCSRLHLDQRCLCGFECAWVIDTGNAFAANFVGRTPRLVTESCSDIVTAWRNPVDPVDAAIVGVGEADVLQRSTTVFVINRFENLNFNAGKRPPEFICKASAYGGHWRECHVQGYGLLPDETHAGSLRHVSRSKNPDRNVPRRKVLNLEHPFAIGDHRR